MSTFPDYYEILGVTTTATADQIKTAYKRKSLVCHPDRIPPGPANDDRRRAATIEFQAVADAFYTLSDAERRRAYDSLRASNSDRTSASAGSSGNYWSDFFGGGAAGEDTPAAEQERPDSDYVFGNVFEEMLRPEVNRVVPFWTWAGAAAGATLGFIAGNLPGAAIGGYAGSKFGAVRDSKGKAVYAVFKDLGADQKAEILKALAAKVFGMSGIGGASSR
ncbi:hypothetical protein JCM5296_000887 [Sporobolomyces johnsonii]